MHPSNQPAAPARPGGPPPAGRPLAAGRSLAIVHERFLVDAGSERVVERWHRARPDAPIHVALCDPGRLGPAFRAADVRTSSLQHLYRGGGRYAHVLPLLPRAFRGLDLDGADVVLVSHHGYAQHVRPGEAAAVVSYVHTPARWMWDASTRAHEGGVAVRGALGALAVVQRRGDRASARRPDVLVAGSTAVRDRIQRWWGRDAVVVHPPVAVTRFTPPPAGAAREPFFLYAGRLVPYKRPLVAVAAAQAAGVPLVVAGDGRQRDAVERAAGPGVEVLGAVDDDTLADLYRRCRALLHPGVEDFGIVAVEAQAAGAPVIARDAGGARDTVLPGLTGHRYPVHGRGPKAEVAALTAAIRAFDPEGFDPAALRAHAEGFAPERFDHEFAAVVDAAVAAAGLR